MSNKKDAISNTPLTITEAIARAAMHLPEDYTVSIHIENGGYNVQLTYKEKPKEVDNTGGVIESINNAICIANGFK